MRKIALASFNIACVISVVIAVWHFFVPYWSDWFSYIPDAPTEIVQSINYINFCFAFLLVGISVLLMAVQRPLFEGARGLLPFYLFFVLLWLARIVIQLIWPWPSGLQLWLVVGFSVEFTLTVIPLIYLLRRDGVVD